MARFVVEVVPHCNKYSVTIKKLIRFFVLEIKNIFVTLQKMMAAPLIKKKVSSFPNSYHQYLAITKRVVVT